MPKNYEIDDIDLKILSHLMIDAKTPYTEIAKKVFVSGGTVHVRMKKMEEFHFTVEGLKEVHAKSGKMVGIMHSLPRNEGEFDFAIDDSHHELYFKQISFSVPLRMSILANIIGV